MELLRTLVQKTSLNTEHSFYRRLNKLRNPHPAVDEASLPCKERVFFEMERSDWQLPLVIKVAHPEQNDKVVDVVIKNFCGEVLVYAEDSSIQTLSLPVLNFVRKTAALVIVLNLTTQTFLDNTGIPAFLHHGSNFLWYDICKNPDCERVTAVARSVKQLGYCSSHVDYYLITSPAIDNFEQHADVHSAMIARNECFEQEFAMAFNLSCPELFGDEHQFLRHALMDLVLVNFGYYQRSLAHVDFGQLVREFAHHLVHQFANAPVGGRAHQLHFPMMLDYSKLCLVCKKDSKRARGQTGQSRKTKYGCEGCTSFYRQEVRLCLLCFAKFHSHIAYYMAKPGENLLKVPLPPPYAQHLQLVRKRLRYEQHESTVEARK